MRARRRCGSHRPRCAWRTAMGALALCCCYAAAGDAVALNAQAPSTDQEVGMAHWGATYVWLRVANAGLVQVYASTGYRSAFVQPVTVSASEADRWATVLDQLGESTNARPASMTSDATPRGRDEESPRVVLGGGDLVLEMDAASTSEPKLRVWVGATRPDAVVAQLVPEDAADAALMLREAARRARNVASAPPASSPTTTAATLPPATPSPAVTATPVAPVAVAAPAPASESNETRASINPASKGAPAASGGAPPDAPSSLASASNSTPLVSARTTTTVASLTSPTARATYTRGREPALSVLRTTTTTKPMRVAASALATVTTVNTAPQRESIRPRPSAKATLASRGSRSTAAPTPAEEAHGVDDATVQNLVGQWRPDLMYCYTQFGLREHTTLTGALVVRLALSPSGNVGRSVIGSRKWSGEGGPDVESCIRSRIAGWRFPPARAGSIHTFSLEFAPGRS